MWTSCSGESEDAERTRPSSTEGPEVNDVATTAGTSVATTAAAQEVATPSVGLAEQFAVEDGGGGGDYCTELGYEIVNYNPPTGPFIGIDDTILPLDVQGALATICIHGFSPDSDISVVVTDPMGEESSFVIQLDGTYQALAVDPLAGATLHAAKTSETYDVWRVRWAVPSTSALGSYHFVARQGSTTAEHIREVIRPEGPYMSLVDHAEYVDLSRDSIGQWIAYGFGPGDVLNTGIYRAAVGEQAWHLVEPLPQLTADSGGAGVLQVPFGSYEPGYNYCVVEAREYPYSNCLNGFTIVP